MLISVVLLVGWFTVASGDIGCRDNNGKAVDWFIVYKLPHLKHSKHDAVRSGVGQMYMDVNNPYWTLLEQPINSSDNAVYYTLQQIYANHQNPDVAYLLYNDETPSGKQSTNHGHTKGDICFDRLSGFWLVHSVPKFPPSASDKYNYPPSAMIFGQTFLCVTYPYKTFNTIGKQLLYNYPQFYSHSLSDKFITENNNIYNAINGTHVSASPWNNSVPLLSTGNQQFISFAKFVGYQQDLYDAWLASYLLSELYVETWLNGPGPLPSNCSTKYHVMNVEKLNVSGEYFRNHEDHAKWATTHDGNWICIGDINREISQKHRAGGTVCSLLPHVSQAFQDSVISTEPCNERKFVLQNRINRK
jgi:deoxyribonuclease-2